MSNRTRPEEDEAAAVISAHLRVPTPVNVDNNREADLRFNTVDGVTAAVEVTTLTDQRSHGSAAAWHRESATPYRSTKL